MIGTSKLAPGSSLAFGEASVWRSAGAVWKQLFGSFCDIGISFEWHEFETKAPMDWGKSFHPGSIEICLNLLGEATVQVAQEQASFTSMSAGFYRQAGTPLSGVRQPNQQHQFITIEFSRKFLVRHLGEDLDGLHPLVAAMIRDNSDASGVGPAQRLTTDQQQLIQSLRFPPVFARAQRVWYEGKALEMASVFFFQPPPSEELFCDRQKRAAQDRVEKVMAILRTDLCAPPTLEELGKRVGCSHFYLSRTFSKETGMTIPQYVRFLRMEKAAELLRSGKFNVTQAAFEVGYSSLSHFSQAFHETYGCCPGLYPVLPNHAGRQPPNNGQSTGKK